MGLKREAHLDNAPAQENEANGPDKGEDKEERLLTTPSGSFAARAVVERQHMEITRAEYAVKPKRPFLPKGFACV